MRTAIVQRSGLRPPLLFGCLLAGALFAAPGGAAELQILLPLNRAVYQTNEQIDLAVVRSSGEGLAAGDLTLTARSNDGSRLEFVFPVAAGSKQASGSRRTEHLHLNGWLLRPGHYQLEATADGTKASTELDVYSHVRRSDYRLINWGRAKPEQRLLEGEDSLGFNTYYGNGAGDEEANFIRAGVDYIANCWMGGAHQMDIRLECDWSDPYVTRGGTSRVAQRAMMDRTRPNVPGVHFYDEPGLTWQKHPVTGEFSPHGIPAQVRSYTAAFGQPPLQYYEVDPKNPDHVARWNHWARWKLGLMNAAWKEAQFGVSQVRADYLSLVQSQYGFSSFTDGYYFNVVRSLPVTSGHGGYHDFGPGYFNPSYFLEMARARDHWKPCWYLPCWYGNTTSDQFRLEQCLSFSTNVQGMISPPDMEPANNPTGRQGIVETNHLFERLGTIFNTMPVTRPPVALLYSLSQCIHSQTLDRKLGGLHSIPHGQNMPLVYLAGKLIQQQFLPIVDEDVLDGTLADTHKAVLLTSVDYLDPAVAKALEQFAAGGGLVLLTADSTVAIPGAVKLAVAPRMPDQEAIDAIMKEKKYNELGPYQTTGKFFAGALPLAKAIAAELTKKDIQPIFESNVPTIVANRQAAGDVEYIFAINATYDEATPTDKNALKATVATIALADDGRPVYDAERGGLAEEFQKQDGKLRGEFHFGPGQMRVFARTSRNIEAVRAATPVIERELVLEKEPLRIDVSAALLNNLDTVLSGSVPMQIQLVDPLGTVRYDVYRATRQGTFQGSFPLAANDPPGKWVLKVRELLSGKEDTRIFSFTPPLRAGSLAGASSRAVSAPGDLDNAFRFARLNHDVTIVCGTSSFNEAAAERLPKILAPWGVRCRRIDLSAAAKPRSLSEEEAKTWVGLHHAGAGQIKPGDGNQLSQAGFAIDGPAILLGNPADNPIIKYLLSEKYLPYTPDPQNFPGAGRGLLAWQYAAIDRGVESITLIAYDEAGMEEAVGTLYEAVAGIEPLTKFALPAAAALQAATSATKLPPQAAIAWSVNLPDRVLAIKPTAAGLSVLTHDGSQTTVAADGKRTAAGPADAEELAAARKPAAPDAALAKANARPDRLLKLAVKDGERVAVAYWGGTVRVVDAQGQVKTEQLLPQDVTSLTWLGNKLITGLADGRLLALDVQ